MNNDNLIDFISESLDNENLSNDTATSVESTALIESCKEPFHDSSVELIHPASEQEEQPTTPHQPASTNIWDPRMVMDLAIGIDDLDEILVRYDLSHTEFNILTETSSFRRELALAMKDVRDKGVTFSSKAKVQAESYLEVLDNLVYDLGTPAGVRLDAIKSAVKWGGLEPKDDKNSAEGVPQVNVQINF